MRTMNVLAAAVVVGLAASPAAAETVTYTGTGTYESLRLLMPLANGGAVVNVSVDTTATIAPSEVGFLHGNCSGLIRISTKDIESATAVCSFREHDQDAFDVELSFSGDHAKVSVLGGSGRWKDASGDGTLTRKYVQGNHGTYQYTFNISTP